jgi:flagellar assembly protein FliH
MSAGSILRGELRDGAASRVVLRAQPAAAPAVPAPAGLWITEHDLAELKRQWMDGAYEQGREQGQRDTQQAAQQKAEAQALDRLDGELKIRDEKHAKEQADKWRGLATALAGQLQSLRERLEAEVSEWTFIATRRLFGERSPDVVTAAVRHVLADACLDAPATILLNPQDLAHVEAARQAEPSAWPSGLVFAASERVDLGGCLVQSACQTLDARLDVQLSLLREALDLARHERLPAEDA